MCRELHPLLALLFSASNASIVAVPLVLDLIVREALALELNLVHQASGLGDLDAAEGGVEDLAGDNVAAADDVSAADAEEDDVADDDDPAPADDAAPAPALAFAADPEACFDRRRRFGFPAPPLPAASDRFRGLRPTCFADASSSLRTTFSVRAAPLRPRLALRPPTSVSHSTSSPMSSNGSARGRGLRLASCRGRTVSRGGRMSRSRTRRRRRPPGTSTKRCRMASPNALDRRRGC